MATGDAALDVPGAVGQAAAGLTVPPARAQLPREAVSFTDGAAAYATSDHVFLQPETSGGNAAVGAEHNGTVEGEH